jgi:hypothetical protein
MSSDIFKVLNNVDVMPLTKEKGKFKYLSWSNAVREASKLFPEMTWEMTKWDHLPYLKTEIGYFVECSVTINGLVKTQMMPVLDFKNQTATSPKANDINKSQMRALTKAIALHGLGIDLWAGEDINGEYEGDGSKKVDLLISNEQCTILYGLLVDADTQLLTNKGMQLSSAFKFKHLSEIKTKDFDKILKAAS